MPEERDTLPLSAAAKIATYNPPPPGPTSNETVQAEHRIRLINTWGIAPGSRVLEIGCGQGTCTAALAEAVGAEGHVDAVDPAPADYGAPFTLAEAQAFMSASEVGPRIAWYRATPEDFLASTKGEWDVAILANCIWYFKNPDVLGGILRELRGRVRKLCLAEYAMRASTAEAVPHLLAALARGTLECHKVVSKANIQTPLAPRAIREIAERVGWQVAAESELVPAAELLDGIWETGTVVGPRFLEEIENSTADERVKVLLQSAREATINAAEAIGGAKKVRTMDVWLAEFVPAAS